MINSTEAFFQELGRVKAIGLAFLVSLPFVGFAVLGFSEAAFAVAFLSYLPFHVWLLISLFMVVFSGAQRQRFLGEGWTFIGSFFGRFFSPYGVACLTFLYTILAWDYLFEVTR